MKSTTVLLLFATSLIAAPGEEEFRALIAESDQVTIHWMDDFPVGDFGLSRIKARFATRVEIDEFASHIAFTEKPPPLTPSDYEFTEEDYEMGRVSIPRTWCPDVEHYTHRIQFFKRDVTIAEWLVAVDGRPQAIIIGEEQRIWISEDSVAWLQKISESDREFTIIRKIWEERKEKWSNPERYDGAQPPS